MITEMKRCVQRVHALCRGECEAEALMREEKCFSDEDDTHTHDSLTEAKAWELLLNPKVHAYFTVKNPILLTQQQLRGKHIQTRAKHWQARMHRTCISVCLWSVYYMT